MTESYDNSTPTAHSLSYDDQNRITQAFGESYSWQDNGQFNQFEGAGFTYNAWRLNAVNLVNGVDRYDYDDNGNMTRRNKGLSNDQTLFWDHENHLQQVKRTADGGVLENYLYDDNGFRVKKSTGGIHIYYTFPF